MDPFVGEIRLFGGNFAPQGWAFCDGSLLPISEYETLFNLIGTTYGGDGQSTFALPDLRGRVPVHMGGNYVIGQSAGTETVTLTTTQIPAHNHAWAAGSSAGASAVPDNNIYGASSGFDMYFPDPDGNDMNAGAITLTGGSQPHENMMPFECVSYIISLYGIWPSQS